MEKRGGTLAPGLMTIRGGEVASAPTQRLTRVAYTRSSVLPSGRDTQAIRRTMGNAMTATAEMIQGSRVIEKSLR